MHTHTTFCTYTYAGMHVCMYACMHVCMYACMHVCMYACMHACVHARTYAHTHTHMHTHTHTHTCIRRVSLSSERYRTAPRRAKPHRSCATSWQPRPRRCRVPSTRTSCCSSTPTSRPSDKTKPTTHKTTYAYEPQETKQDSCEMEACMMVGGAVDG